LTSKHRVGTHDQLFAEHEIARAELDAKDPVPPILR
jgi:hypothetical protein